MATTAFVVRDSAGLRGLVALGAALSGGQYAWTLPFAWLAFSFFAPPPTAGQEVEDAPTPGPRAAAGRRTSPQDGGADLGHGGASAGQPQR